MCLEKSETRGTSKTLFGLICTLIGITVLLFTVLPVQAAVTQWTPHGPYGGQVNCLVADPVNPAIYAGTSSGGIFKSIDGGITWSAMNTGLANSSAIIQALVVDPKNPLLIYAGSNGGFNTSSDGGANWSLTVFSVKITNTNINSLAIDPVTPTTIYAGTNGGGVLKSTNGGAGWVQNTVIGNKTVTALAVNPITPATIYGATNGGVFKSTDAGVTWLAANAGLSNLLVKALVIDPATPATIYAATGGGIFKSIDAAVTWNAVNSGLTILTVQSLAVDSTAPATLYAGTSGGVFKSSNAGVSWSAINTGLNGNSVKALIIDPLASTNLYAGSSAGGVFKSTDNGGNWIAANTGLSSIMIGALAIDPIVPNTMYMGTSGYGVFKSVDRGGNWSAVNVGLSNLSISVFAIDPQVSTTIYTGTSNGGVFMSSDGAGTWSARNTGLTNIFVQTLAVDFVTPATIYVGTSGGGVFKSVDAGVNWSAFNTGLTKTTINALALDTVTPAIIYAGTMGGGVFKSINGGVGWSASNSGLLTATATVNTLVVDPVTPSTIYAGTTDGLFKSSDAGVTWSLASTGLGRLATATYSDPIISLVIDPTTPTTLYTQVNGFGIYKSMDGGASWSSLPPPLYSPTMNRLALDRITPSILYVGTGGGLFTLDSIVNGYTVTFNSNGGSAVAAQVVVSGGTALTPTAPNLTGSTFAGWYSDTALTTAFAFTTPITGNTTLYAKWTVNSYTVSFNSNGGSTVASQSIPYGSTATSPIAPTLTGSTFVAWYSDAALTTAFVFTTPITGNTTLYAKWTVNSYTVNFNSNGGSAVTGQTVNYNGIATTPAVPTLTGSTFAGWYSDAALATAFVFTTPITGNTTLYAKWTVNSYTITTTAGANGSITPTTVANYGASATVTVTPNAGYHLFSVLVDGISQVIVDPKSFSTTFNTVTANHSIIADFAVDTINLAVTINGTGRGSVTNATTAASCNTSSTLTAAMGTNLLQVLTAEYSLFTGWSGGSCSGTGDCTLNIPGTTAVTATFDFDVLNSVKLERTTPVASYSTLQLAYDAALLNGDVIKAWSVTYTENLLLAGAKTVTLKGGYRQNYATVTGMTTIQGTVTLVNGTTVLDGIVIR